MGQATTTKAINLRQLHVQFPSLPLEIRANDLTSTTEEKAVVVAGKTNAEIASVLNSYTYDADYGVPQSEMDARAVITNYPAVRAKIADLINTPGATFDNASQRDRAIALILALLIAQRS